MSDKDNHKLKVVSVLDGTVATFAGSGVGRKRCIGTDASFSFLTVCLSASGNWPSSQTSGINGCARRRATAR